MKNHTPQYSRYLKLLFTFTLFFSISACAPIGLVNAVSHTYPATITTDISYGELPRQKFDLYLPEEHLSSRPTPVLVYFYGGSWNSGNKSIYEFLGRRFASLGYIVAIPNYGLYPEVTYPEFLKDSAAAVKAITDSMQQPEFQKYRPDSQVILMGHSAGAYNAAMLSLDPRWLAAQHVSSRQVIKAWIGVAGPYDLYPIEVKKVQPVFHHPNYPPNSNPIELVAGAQQPVLFLVAENDRLVDPQRNSYAMAEALRSQQIQAKTITISGTNHGTIIGTLSPLLFYKDSILPPIQEFITSLYPVVALK